MFSPTASQSYEDRITAVGAEVAYQEFSQNISTLPVEDQHSKAHEFGAALYQVEKQEGIGVCDSQFHYGCFHEFIGRALLDIGTDNISTLADLCRTRVESGACRHGLGHGIIAYLGYDFEALQEGLTLCKKVEGERGRSCYVGLFMEYNDRTMLGKGALSRSKEEGVHSPCITLPQEFQSQCYFTQPHWWQHTFFKQRSLPDAFKEMGILCRGAAAAYREVCFEGVGYQAYPSGGFIKEKAETLCSFAAQSRSEREACVSEVGLLVTKQMVAE